MAKLLSENEIDRRITVLTKSARAVLEMFHGGHAPTKAQLNTLDGACSNLDSIKVCGHVIREECNCDDR